MHLDLRLLMFLKFMKKSMSISLQTYEKKGGAALFQIAMAAVRSKLLSNLLKKHWFLCEATNLDLQPALSLTKDVRTPNSVWGKIGVNGSQKRRFLRICEFV